jgi:integrase
MAKQRTGYVYEEIIWYGVVSYTDDKGKRQTVKRRATSEAHAEQIAKEITKKLKGRFGSSLKADQKTLTQTGGWIARLTLTGEGGKRRNIKRICENKTEAKEELRRLLRKYEDQGEQALDGDTLTFRELANLYRERNLVPAEYHGERKIRGLRSVRTPRGHLKVLTERFGSKRIKNITHSDIEEFKQIRLKTPTHQDKQRTIASVNRELELLRAVLRFAARQGWLSRSPFEMGMPLISKADEVRRERVLTHEEEKRLLSVCTGRRAHLRAILIAALDTAMRRGELFKLTWQDIDLENRLIQVRATTTKTLRPRTVGITERLATELTSLYESSTKTPEGLVFGITDTVKKAFASVCQDAGVEGFRFHDARHTAITRMIQSGMPAHLIMKVSGHTQPVTFARYVNVDGQTARQAAVALELLNRSVVVEAEAGLVN